jgi:hypothetical protein
MRYLYLFVFLILTTFKSAYAQQPEQKSVTDTIVTEEIVYEIDTVYLQPDTINLSDTIINYIKQHKKHTWFVQAGVSPYVSGIFDFGNVDTLQLKKTINYAVDFTLAYSFKTSFLGINIGFTQLQENLSYPGISYSSIAQSSGGAFYDSLSYAKTCSYRNYFNYLNIGVVFGRKWKGVRKISYSTSANAGCDILLSESAYSVLSDSYNKIPLPTSDIRKLSVSLGLSAALDYTLAKNTEFFFAPYVKFSLRLKKDYPLSSLTVIGFSVGLRRYF